MCLPPLYNGMGTVPKIFPLFFTCSPICCPMPCGCTCPTRQCTSLFGMTNMWWPYLDFFLVTYGGYHTGGFHPPLYLMMGPTDWYPAAAVAPLPSHCLGTDTFVYFLLHASFSVMWPILVRGSRTLSGFMYHARAASGESGFLKCLQISSITPQNRCARQSAPTFPFYSLMFSNPAYTASTPRLCSAFIPKIISGTRNKSTALDFWCCTTLEVGVVFYQTSSEFLRWYDWCAVFLDHPPPCPKFPVRSNGWKP